MENNSKKQFVPVFSFFLLLLAGWFIYSTIGIVNVFRTKSWTETTGIVISSDVKRVATKGSSQFSPAVTYSYTVDATEYQSEKYSSTSARGSSTWAKELVGRLSPGTPVKVYFNPENPVKAVLNTDLQHDNYWMTGLSAFFFAVVLLAFIKQLKTSKTGQQQ
jgi:hypothetical protein